MFRTRQRSAKTPAKGEEMTIARLKTIRTYARARCIDALHCSARRAADQPYALAVEEMEEQRRCERPPVQQVSNQPLLRIPSQIAMTHRSVDRQSRSKTETDHIPKVVTEKTWPHM